MQVTRSGYANTEQIDRHLNAAVHLWYLTKLTFTLLS